jgi:hypothetical protein
MIEEFDITANLIRITYLIHPFSLLKKAGLEADGMK